MKGAVDEEIIKQNRVNFLAKHKLKIQKSCLVAMSYNREDYCRYRAVSDIDGGEGMVRSGGINDSLFTTSKGISLFLPLADCIGAVMYDTKNDILGLAHLGRHNLEQYGGKINIEFMQKEYRSKPQDITVFLSAAAGKYAYPLFSFDNKSLHEVAIEQLQLAGVLKKNITVDSRDTTIDDELFSHSNYLKGVQNIDGRHAVVTYLV